MDTPPLTIDQIRLLFPFVIGEGLNKRTSRCKTPSRSIGTISPPPNISECWTSKERLEIADPTGSDSRFQRWLSTRLHQRGGPSRALALGDCVASMDMLNLSS